MSSTDTQFPNPLAGKRELVLGGTSGVGFAVASGVLASGASVHVASSQPAKVGKAVERLRGMYPELVKKISGSTCDLGTLETQDAQLRTLLAAAVQSMAGRMDHIMFTAGDSLTLAPLADLKTEHMVAAGTVRFFGAVSLARVHAGPESDA
jgi:NAD(P)-dependent dehydrogenase (short-subunit alcohol dehydrogenase family)